MLYRNFGFNIKSDIELPFLIDEISSSKVDIQISKALKKPEYTNSAKVYSINISSSKQLICKVIEQKKSLIMDFENYVCFQYIYENDQYLFHYYFYYDYPKEWKERLISRFGMAYLFSWMGMTVLHGSAVCNHKQAICFIADSNGGKSSVAGLFVANGWLLMADELIVLKPDNKEMILLPSSHYLHLSDDALKKMPFSHYPSSPLVFQFKNDFMNISESTNRVNLQAVSSFEKCKCQKIIVLDRGHDGVKFHQYKKADAYIKLLHYLYTPIVFPTMRKNLMALMKSIKLKQACFNDCFIQFKDIEKICKGE